MTKKTTTAGTAALLCRSKYGRYHGQNIIGSMGKIAIFPNYASEAEKCWRYRWRSYADTLQQLLQRELCVYFKNNDIFVKKMDCSCKAGSSHCCKHIVAVLLFCNRYVLYMFLKWKIFINIYYILNEINYLENCSRLLESAANKLKVPFPGF